MFASCRGACVRIGLCVAEPREEYFSTQVGHLCFAPSGFSSAFSTIRTCASRVSEALSRRSRRSFLAPSAAPERIIIGPHWRMRGLARHGGERLTWASPWPPHLPVVRSAGRAADILPWSLRRPALRARPSRGNPCADSRVLGIARDRSTSSPDLRTRVRAAENSPKVHLAARGQRVDVMIRRSGAWYGLERDLHQRVDSAQNKRCVLSGD